MEVPEEYVGAVVDMLGKRRGQMLDMSTSGYVHSKWTAPLHLPCQVQNLKFQLISYLTYYYNLASTSLYSDFHIHLNHKLMFHLI